MDDSRLTPGEVPILEKAMDLFDRLLESKEPAAVLAAEPDPELRWRAERLWRHHLLAGDQSFLERPLDFRVEPVFQAGQVLLKRFEIERPLGEGGMGEVYLAFDRTLRERVAIKTIARLLASSDWIRLRFVAEVKNARRVTHPNVCRIHEIFEDGEIPFFAMEYVDGCPLPKMLEQKQTRKWALGIVLQLAEGLHGAHRNGVVHGDFKPANVLIEQSDPQRAVIMDFGLARALGTALTTESVTDTTAAGTIDYMAPELLSGALPSVSTDVFAFGVVAQSLLPGDKLWQACVEPNPAARLTSLEPVIQHLRRDQTRRYWIGGALVTAAGAIVYGERLAHQPHVQLPEGARILINGFRAPVEDSKIARLARGLFLTGVAQSPRIHPLVDEDLLPALHRLGGGATLPVAGNLLTTLLNQLNAAFWIDGEIQAVGQRISMTLRLLSAQGGQLLVEQAFRDFPTVVAAAAEAAHWLRQTSGESDASLRLNAADASEFSSTVPEALSKYYDAMAYYAVGQMDQALPLFREAVRLDPNFAQARASLANCLNSFGHFDQSFAEAEQAFRLSARLPGRERAWVEFIYYTLADDPSRMVEAARRTLSYNQNEHRFLRGLARNLARTGYAADGVPYLKQAVALQPNSALLRLDLIEVMCEAGQYAEALQAYEERPDLSAATPILQTGRAFALLGLERYREALAAANAVSSSMPRLRPACQILLGHLDVAESVLLSELGRLETEGALLDRVETRIFLCGLYSVTGQRGLATSQLREALAFPLIPRRARYLEEAAFWAARLGDAGILSDVLKLAAENAAHWPTGRAQSLLHYVKGLIGVEAGNSDTAESEITKASGAGWALWSLFDLAELYGKAGRKDLAAAYWQRWEEKRGVILSYYFTGVLPLAWVKRAELADASGDRAAARALAQKVLSCWGARNLQLSAVRTARDLVGNSF